MREHTLVLPELPDQTTSLAGTSPPPSSNVGDEVMRILGDIEGQLNHLRTTQQTQDQNIISLTDRSKALRQAENDFEKATQELAHQQQALKQERDQFDAQQQQFQTQRKQTDREFRQQQSELAELRRQLKKSQTRFNTQSDELQRRQAELEQSQKSLRQEQQAQEAQLAKRHSELESKAADLAAEQTELNALRQTLTAQSVQCRLEQDQLNQRSKQLDAERHELQSRVDKAEKNVGDLIAEVERANQDLTARTKQIIEVSSEVAALRERTGSLEKALHEATQRADQADRDAVELARLADRERNEVANQLTAAQKNIQELQAALADRTAQHDDSLQKLELAGKKLTEFAQILSEQTPQLERGAAALLMVQQQQEQIERLTSQLAEHTLRSDPEEVQRRDQRITDLTEALRQARGQAAGQQGIAELEQRNAELACEVDRLKIAAQNAQLSADQVRQQLQVQTDGQALQSVQDAATAEYASKVASLTAQLDQMREAAARSKLDADSSSRGPKNQRAKSSPADAATIQKLKVRVQELEKLLSQAASSNGSSSPSEAAYSKTLQENAQKVTAIAEHLRRRRARLGKYHRLVQQKRIASGAVGEEVRTEELVRIETARAQLLDVRRMLAAAEQIMIRKWAAPRAVLAIACLVIVAGLCAAASWVAADSIFPAQRSASVMIEARNRERAPLSDEEAQAWSAWHSEILWDEDFQKTLAKRMAERRFDQYADPASLAQRLRMDLTIDAHQPAQMTLTLAGTDEHEVTSFMDILTATLVTESKRQMSKRGQNAWAVAATERRDEGGVRYAQLNPVAIHDQRFSHALPIFGGMCVVVLALIAIAYTQFRRAKRVFDQENSGLFAEGLSRA